MKSHTQATQEIGCTKFLKAIGDFWTLRIITVLGTGERRFCELERALPDINAVTLTNRLKKMETTGLLERRTEGEQRQPVFYFLTKKGKDLFPIAERIEDYALKYGDE